MTTTTTAENPRTQGTTNVVLDHDGVIRGVSASGEHMLGKASDDLIGTNIADLLRERQGSNLVFAIQKAADAGWTGGLGRHWLVPASRQDMLVDVFLDSIGPNSNASSDGLHRSGENEVFDFLRSFGAGG